MNKKLWEEVHLPDGRFLTAQNELGAGFTLPMLPIPFLDGGLTWRDKLQEILQFTKNLYTYIGFFVKIKEVSGRS